MHSLVVSVGFRSVPGVFKGFLWCSNGFEGVPRVYQEVSGNLRSVNDVPQGFKCFQKRFKSIPRVFQGVVLTLQGI